MECINMRKRGNQFLSMEVPGLAERRPSLVHGDYIFAKVASENANDGSRIYQVCDLCFHHDKSYLWLEIVVLC